MLKQPSRNILILLAFFSATAILAAIIVYISWVPIEDKARIASTYTNFVKAILFAFPFICAFIAPFEAEQLRFRLSHKDPNHCCFCEQFADNLERISSYIDARYVQCMDETSTVRMTMNEEWFKYSAQTNIQIYSTKIEQISTTMSSAAKTLKEVKVIAERLDQVEFNEKLENIGQFNCDRTKHELKELFKTTTLLDLLAKKMQERVDKEDKCIEALTSRFSFNLQVIASNIEYEAVTAHAKVVGSFKSEVRRLADEYHEYQEYLRNTFQTLTPLEQKAQENNGRITESQSILKVLHNKLKTFARHIEEMDEKIEALHLFISAHVMGKVDGVLKFLSVRGQNFAHC